MEHADLKLAFSVSATSRAPRGQEKQGEAYFFMSVEEFRDQIQAGAFVEFEEVYPDMFYGTLHSEIERIWAQGKHVVFDIDAVGGINIKNKYPTQTCSIFIKPPNMEVLSQRLYQRNTDSSEAIEVRLQKATQEMAMADQFDHIITNDNLKQAQSELYRIVADFLNQ